MTGVSRIAALAAIVLGVVSVAPDEASAFAKNSFRFESMPIKWWYNPANEPPPPPGTTWEELITRATQTWSDVGCAEISFQYEGHTDVGQADDGMNVIYWPEEWLYQEAAAGATLHDPQDEGEPREVELALNATGFTWTVGGGDAFETHVLDAQSVLTHELGHWLGLSHSSDQFATMYQAKLIGTMQASLNSDDKFGVCSIYPNGQNECETHADCPEGYACHDEPGGDLRACGELRTPIGGHCSKDVLDCVDMCFITFWDCSAICAFTAEDYTDGYCAQLCLNANGEERECPDGHTCTDVPGYDIKACYKTPEPQPDDVEAEPDQGAEPAAELSAELAPDSAAEDTVLLTGGCSGGGPAPTVPVSAIAWLLLALGVSLRRRV